MLDDQLQVKHLKDYALPSRNIDKVSLQFHIHNQYIDVKNQMVIDETTEQNKALILDGIDLELMDIKINNKVLNPVQYEITTKELIIFKIPQEQFIIEINNRIYPSKNTCLEGVYLSNNIICSQCEAEGFRRITYFLDRPDVLTKFQCKIIADQNQFPVLLSNGNIIEKGTEGKKHYVVWDDPFRKPCYLFALVAGDLDVVHDTFITASKKSVDLNIYCEKEKTQYCHYALQCLKNAMLWDEKTYQLEYDLDCFNVVAIEDFNAGAMENKGLNIFNANLVYANLETATDRDYENINAVIAHEYFHNWTGNRVTLKNWFQLCLKEGLTVFREQQYMESQTEKIVKRIEDIQFLKNYQFVEDAGPMAHPVQPKSYIEMNNFYTTTVYEKGSEIFRLIETFVGKKQFNHIVKTFLREFDGQAVSIEDFFIVVESLTELDIKKIRRWIDLAGTPEITISCNSNKKNKTVDIDISQSIPNTFIQQEDLPLPIPFNLKLYGLDNQEIEIKNNLLNECQPNIYIFDQKQIKIELPYQASSIALSMNRNFSAPITINYEYTEDEILHLLKNESDRYILWEMHQKLKEIVLLTAYGSDKQNEFTKNSPLYTFFQFLIKLIDTEPAFVALCLQFPNEKGFSQKVNRIKPEKISSVLKNTIIQYAHLFQDQFAEIYLELNQKHQNTISNQAISIRKLKNTLLYLLNANTNQTFQSYAQEQYYKSQNMTDRFAALLALNQNECDEREECVRDYFNKWKHNQQTYQKWLRLEGSFQNKKTLEKLRMIEKSDEFNIKNPNHVRLLFGVFTQSNFSEFNHANLSGYDYIVEKITQLNKINPQLSAYLCKQFAFYNKLEDKRKEKIKDIIDQLLKLKELNNNAKEVLQNISGTVHST